MCWSATTGRHVGFESWLERDRLMLLDFDPDVVGIASLPFWLLWTAGNGRTRSHAPDYFVRLADGRGLVVDVRPPGRIKPRDAVAFDLTRRCCEALGWDYTVLGADDEVLVANVRWLATATLGKDAGVWPSSCAGSSPPGSACTTVRNGSATHWRCCRCCSTCSGSTSSTPSCPGRCTRTLS